MINNDITKEIERKFDLETDYYQPEFNEVYDLPTKSEISYEEKAEQKINKEINIQLNKSVDAAIRYVRFSIMATKNTLNRKNDLSTSSKYKLTTELGIFEKKLVFLNEMKAKEINEPSLGGKTR